MDWVQHTGHHQQGRLVAAAHVPVCSGAAAVVAARAVGVVPPSMFRPLTWTLPHTSSQQLAIKATIMGYIHPHLIPHPQISVRSNDPEGKIVFVKICSSTLEQITSTDHDTLVDTGASHHCVTNKKYFIYFDYNFNPSATVLEFADGSKRSDLILAKGIAQIPLIDVTGTLRNVILKDALYIPSFTRNIMSLRQAVSK